MDYNRIYRARYLYKVAGVTDIKEITEQTGLSLEMARKAVNNSMADYPRVKQDYAEDEARGDFSRNYEVPPVKRLVADKLQSAVERYVKLVVYEGKSLDQIKSLLIADDLKDTQITAILKDVESKVAEHRTEALENIVEQLLAIEQLPPKWTVNKAMTVVEVFPSPMVDRSGHIYGVKYTRKPVNWRKDLPTELAIALYARENPLFIDGHKINPNPDQWGPAEYAVIIGTEYRKRGFYKELAEYLGMEYEELKPYLTRARGYLASVEMATQTEPTDFKKVARRVAVLMAEYKAQGGNVKIQRSRKTAVTE